jgi:hypothetical protein
MRRTGHVRACDLTAWLWTGLIEDQPRPKELDMRRGQRTSAEQVVLKLPQIEVQTAQGKGLALAWTEAEISEQSYRWQGVRWPSSRPGQEDQGPGARECSAAAAHGGSVSGGSGAGGRRLGERVAPERRRQAVDGIREKYGLSERHACRIVGQHRGRNATCRPCWPTRMS